MIRKAVKELLLLIILYSLSFQLPSWFTASPESAQRLTSLILPFLIVVFFLGIRHEGMMSFLGLACPVTEWSYVAKRALPYCVVLLIPLLNIVFSWESTDAASKPLMVILICSAVIEEICFRGYLLSILLDSGQNKLAAVCVTSVAFAAMHLFNLGNTEPVYVIAQCIVAGSVGLVFGFSRLSTKSIYPSIMGHILINITSNRGLLYDETDVWIFCIVAVLAGVQSYLVWERSSKAGKE